MFPCPAGFSPCDMSLAYFPQKASCFHVPADSDPAEWGRKIYMAYSETRFHALRTLFLRDLSNSRVLNTQTRFHALRAIVPAE